MFKRVFNKRLISAALVKSQPQSQIAYHQIQKPYNFNYRMFSSKNNDDAAESVYSKFEEVKAKNNMTEQEILDKSENNTINFDDVNLYD